MPLSRLKEFLDENRIHYTVRSHAPAYTAMATAAAAHVPGKELAKTVVVKLDGRTSMAVVPSSYRVNLQKLAAATGSRKAEIAKEDEIKDLFPGCDLGAMPPFGNLYHLPVYVSGSLAEDKTIAFPAGTHTEVMSLAFSDFERVVKPKTLHFSEHI